MFEGCISNDSYDMFHGELLLVQRTNRYSKERLVVSAAHHRICCLTAVVDIFVISHKFEHGMY